MSAQAIELVEPDVRRLTAAFEDRVRAACPDQLALARDLLERLPPTRWTLEWHLAWWLGAAFGLDRTTADAITLSNLFGMGAIRLEDDLADGDVSADEVRGASVLRAVLFDAALEVYHHRFEPGSPFWPHFERTMSTWRMASDPRDGQSNDPDAAFLAGRGAPLRISAYAVCLAAGCLERYPPIERCLDHALAALVLLDQVADWEADIAGGRWNAFVAAVSPGPQVAWDRDRHRRAVLVALLTGDPAASWWGRIDDELGRAIAAARALTVPVPPLADHLRSFREQAGREGAVFCRHYRELGDEAARWLFHDAGDRRS